MKVKRIPAAVLLLATGVNLLGIGSCLGLDLNRVVRFGAAYATSEFLIDNDALFDLFEDGEVRIAGN
jgi:hypothetical protein